MLAHRIGAAWCGCLNVAQELQVRVHHASAALGNIDAATECDLEALSCKTANIYAHKTAKSLKPQFQRAADLTMIRDYPSMTRE